MMGGAERLIEASLTGAVRALIVGFDSALAAESDRQRSYEHRREIGENHTGATAERISSHTVTPSAAEAGGSIVAR